MNNIISWERIKKAHIHDEYGLLIIIN